MNRFIHLHQLAQHAAAHERDANTPLIEAILFVPSAETSVFLIDANEIPKRYLSQALVPIVEDLVAEELDELHLCHGSLKKGERLVVMVTRKQTMQAWLDSASASGIKPLAIYPDFYSLEQSDQISVNIYDDYAIVRLNTHQGFSGSSDEVLNLLTLEPSDAPINIFSDVAPQTPNGLNTTVTLVEPSTPKLHGTAINLLQGTFAPHKKHNNPYKAYMWPLALTALLFVALSLNYWVSGRYYQQQHALVQTAVAQDYRRLFGTAPSGDWLSGARYQSALAATQLNSDQLGHWQLLRLLNESLDQCPQCQVEEISLNNNTLLLSLAEANSQPLVDTIKNSHQLHLHKQHQTESIITLTISLTTTTGSPNNG